MRRRDRPMGPEGRKYHDIRKSVADGDLFLFQGHGLLSWLITKFSGSKYSHSGIAFWWRPEGADPRLMVFQAIGKGVVCTPASSTVYEYSGRVDWYALTEDARSKVKLPLLFEKCVHNVGKPFGVKGLFVYAWHKVFGGLENHPENDHPKAMFCSWYVSYCIREAGCDPDPAVADAMTSPGALAESQAVELKHTLHNSKDSKRG